MGADPNQNPSAGGADQAATAAKPPPKDLKKKKDEKKEEDLSAEDLALKQQLELYVERVHDSDPGVQRLALESVRQEIRTATSSMTSVPKPLKFLRPHYGTLKAYFETMAESDVKKYLADILSVLAMTMSAEGERRQSEDIPIDDIMELVQQIVTFHMKHNAEPEAVDLLMEVFHYSSAKDAMVPHFLPSLFHTCYLCPI